MASPAKRLLVSISVVAALVLAAAVAARLALPGWLKGKVESLASRATGRALSIGGPIELSLFGSPTLAVSGVRFANAPGGSEPSMVTAGRLEVSLALRPLLSGEIRIHRIELQDIRVLLERDGRGNPNWRLDRPERAPATGTKRKVVVDEAVLRGFRLTYRAGGPLKPLEFGIETFSARRDAVTDMVALDGRGDFNAEAWHLAGTIGPVTKILEGRDVDQALTGGIGGASLSLTGHLRDPMTLGGPSLRIDVGGPDIVAALAVFGLRSPLTGPFKVDGRLSPHGEDIGVDLIASVDGVEAKAAGTLDTLLGLSRAEARVEASGPDGTVIGRWTRVRGLPRGPFRAAGTLRWGDRMLGLAGVDVAAGGIRARVDGTIGGGIDLGVVADGKDLAVLSALTTLRLPSGPFALRGRFSRRGRVLAIDATELQLRDTTIRASGTIGTPPRCADLDLTAAGEGPDASILSGIARVDLPAERFDLRGRVAWDGGTLRLDKVAGHLGRETLEADGTIVPVAGLAGSEGEVRVGGEELAHTLEHFGVRGLPAQPFDAAGRVAVSAHALSFDGVVVRVGAMDAHIDGQLGLPRPLDGTTLDLRVSGDRLSDLAAWGVGTSLPPDPFQAEGKLAIDGGVYRLEHAVGTVGTETIAAEGALGALPSLDACDLRVKAQGPSVAALGRFVTAAELPRLPAEPFELSAGVRRAPGGIAFSEARASVGAAKIALDGTLGSATDVTVHVEAPDTALAAALLGATLPEGALSADGRVGRDPTGRITFQDAKLGIGAAYVEVSGTLGAPPDLERSSFDLAAEGPDLASVLAPLTGLSPLPKDSFAIEGHFEGDRRRIATDRLIARLGDGDVAGSLAVALGEIATVEADLKSKHLDVARLISGFTEPAEETTPAKHADKRALIIPETPISLAALRRLRTSLRLQADEVAFPGVPMTGVTIEGGARDGGLHVERFEGTGKNGGVTTLQASLVPDGETYRFQARGALTGGRLAVFGKKEAAKEAPTLDVEFDLTGTGASPHAILASSNGKATVQLGPGHIPNSLTGTLSSGFLLSLLDTLNPFRKSSPDTPLECGVAAAVVENGKVVVDPIATRTDKLTIVGHGQLDLTSEAIDLVWTLKPRRGVGISAGTIVNPFIKLGGTLSSPKLDAKPLEAAATTGAAVATAGITILLKGFYDRITAETNVCAKALKKAKKQEEKRAKKIVAPGE